MLFPAEESAEATIRVAAERFINSMRGLKNPEKVSDNQYELALKFLKECDSESSSTGTPIQRLAFYFSRALFEKIANETGRVIVKSFDGADPVESVMFWKSILDHVEINGMMHIIDLEIRTGIQWIILMQDLASRPVQRLRVTAVGTRCRPIIEETGSQLACFVRSLNIDFAFNVVMVAADFSDLSTSLFDASSSNETVVVYSAYALANLVGRVEQLDHLMMVLRGLKLCVMILTELEANCNSPAFVERFVESLFFFGVFFDSLECCFRHDETSRVEAESCWFGSCIRNVLVADGDERKFRHMGISVWRAFFARYELAEMELSALAVNKAYLGLQRVVCGRSCTLYRDGKCSSVGWKGTPLSSVSTWRF
ncbi:DELLA protein RGL2-like [Salvia splendens]|uniref:DELLA protein RGL2-like n=1 Tax=Salvia splendens TaxID=180675 RepID=UPI001C27192E|nr:DELLA protein RGL2-like [Salvia splendens]